MKVELNEEDGVPTDILSSGADSFIVGTSHGYALQFTRREEGEFTLKGRWKIFKSSSIRRLVLLKEDLVLVSSSKGKLVSLNIEKGERKSVECDQKLGVISALAYDGATLFVGNDDGDVHSCILSPENSLTVERTFDHHDDYISNLLVVPVKKTLLVGSGDGTMSVIDLKRNKAVAMTKNFEDDVTVLQLVGNSGKVILGTAQGSIKAFKWNYWGAPCDSLKAKYHDFASLNDMLSIESVEGAVIITASSEGKLRMMPSVQLTPGVELLAAQDSFERLAWLPDGNDGTGTILAITADGPIVHCATITTDRIKLLFSAIDGDSDSEDATNTNTNTNTDTDNDTADSDDGGAISDSSVSIREARRPVKKIRSSVSCGQNFFQELD
jgi:WD40 repeat protein